jgi:hypothetical protein
VIIDSADGRCRSNGKAASATPAARRR